MRRFNQRMAFPLMVLAALQATACIGFTREEAKVALDEIEINAQTSSLTASGVEIATNFTIGDAAEQAAQNLRDFVETQLPCAEVVLDGATLTTTYGAKPGNCRWRGMAYSGSHSMEIQRNERAAVQVSHVWTDFSNGIMEVDGEAMVTWDFEDRTRRVVHSAEWTRLEDGRTGQGGGDRTQSVLEGGLLTGFQVDGEREWRGRKGDWELDIEGVQMRWVDPVPQAGRYVLDTPFDKKLTVKFARQSSTRIQVTLEGPRNSFDFDVVTLPE